MPPFHESRTATLLDRTEEGPSTGATPHFTANDRTLSGSHASVSDVYAQPLLCPGKLALYVSLIILLSTTKLPAEGHHPACYGGMHSTESG